jgi:hypothetical protein
MSKQQQDLSHVICRYCKQTGHYKQKCPKLTNKPPRDNQSRQFNHDRLLRPNHHIKPACEKIIITEPVTDEFPALCEATVQPSPSIWGKSFVDIAKTRDIDIKELEKDPDEVIFEILK